MAFKKKTQEQTQVPQSAPPSTQTTTESANSRPWRKEQTPAPKQTGEKSKLVQVAGMFMNEKNGKSYFRGKVLKGVEGYGAVIPAGITFLLFEAKEGSKVDGNLVLTVDSK